MVYRGPDARYNGREICFNANEDTLTIVDVTDKSAPTMLARKFYPGKGYAHQGWLTEDHRHFLLDDEKDETKLRVNSRTHIFDVSDLDLHQDATEEIENNNVRPRFIRIGPDLTITALTAPATAVAGAQVSVSDTTQNGGGASTERTLTRLVLSKNQKVDGTDVELAVHDVPALDPGQSLVATTPVIIPVTTTPGAYFVIAVVDPNDGPTSSMSRTTGEPGKSPFSKGRLSAPFSASLEHRTRLRSTMALISEHRTASAAFAEIDPLASKMMRTGAPSDALTLFVVDDADRIVRHAGAH